MIKPLFNKISVFKSFESNNEFGDVCADAGGYGSIWNDKFDLSCDELWDNGIEAETPFDGLIAFFDAAEL